MHTGEKVRLLHWALIPCVVLWNMSPVGRLSRIGTRMAVVLFPLASSTTWRELLLLPATESPMFVSVSVPQLFCRSLSWVVPDAYELGYNESLSTPKRVKLARRLAWGTVSEEVNGVGEVRGTGKVERWSHRSAMLQ